MISFAPFRMETEASCVHLATRVASLQLELQGFEESDGSGGPDSARSLCLHFEKE
jgi:hypothetical protein